MMMSRSSVSAQSFCRYFYTFLTFVVVSFGLFLLSIVTYLLLRKHLMPISHLSVPLELFRSSDQHLISRVNLTDPMSDYYPLDIFSHSYRVEIDCRVPRSFINRHLGSFSIEIQLISSEKQLIVQHSRRILFPYQSDVVRLARTILFLPLNIFNLFDDRWRFNEILIERLRTNDLSKRNFEKIDLKIFPSDFQIEKCRIDFHVLDLRGLTYSLFHYPMFTGCLASCILFSIYMTFYLLISALTILNQNKDETKR